MDQQMDRIEVPAGTMVKLGGMPFELAAHTVLLGRRENYVAACAGVTGVVATEEGPAGCMPPAGHLAASAIGG